jgi:hypothetical protein
MAPLAAGLTERHLHPAAIFARVVPMSQTVDAVEAVMK